MKFLADMGISPKTVKYLKAQGYDAIHLLEDNLEKLPDEEILAKAKQENRIVLTVDLDFTDLLAMTKADFPSVILFRLGNQNVDVINDRLADVLADNSQSLTIGAIISVTDKNIRVKKLPI